VDKARIIPGGGIRTEGRRFGGLTIMKFSKQESLLFGEEIAKLISGLNEEMGRNCGKTTSSGVRVTERTEDELVIKGSS
jgi:hypothetical protein